MDRPETVQPSTEPLSVIRSEVLPKIAEWYEELWNSHDKEPHEIDQGDRPDPPSMIYEALQKAYDLGVADNIRKGEASRLRMVIMDLAAQLTASSILLRNLRAASIRDQADLEKVAGVLQEGQSLITAQVAANDEAHDNANTEYRK